MNSSQNFKKIGKTNISPYCENNNIFGRLTCYLTYISYQFFLKKS